MVEGRYWGVEMEEGRYWGAEVVRGFPLTGVSVS